MAGAVAPNFVNRTLWTRDNLDVLRGLNSASIDLVYADPPFNSNKNYKTPIGTKAADAIRPFFCQVEAVGTPRRVCIMPHRKNGYGFLALSAQPLYARARVFSLHRGTTCNSSPHGRHRGPGYPRAGEKERISHHSFGNP